MSNSRYNHTITALDDTLDFTGSWENCLEYNEIVFSCFSDSTCKVRIDFTENETDINSNHYFQAEASVHLTEHVPVRGKQYRIYLLNDSGVNQTVLRLHSHLKNTASNVKTNLGFTNNVFNNETVNASTVSSSLNISDYSNGILLYSDSSILANTATLKVEVSTDDVYWHVIGTIIPLVNGNQRDAVANLPLHGVSYLRLTNSSVDTYQNVRCSIVGNN